MRNYRVSVTLLEKFRRYQVADDSNTWDTEQSVIDQLTGVFTGNEKTRVGSAFHKLIEDGKPEMVVCQGEESFHLSQGHLFTEQQANVAYDYKKAHAAMFCEVPAGKFYHTQQANFYLSGKVDGIEGVRIRDAKTKYSTPDAQSYIDSCQWKFYLDILGLKTFFFDVFEVKSWPKDGLTTTLVRKSDPVIMGDEFDGVSEGIEQVVDLAKLRIMEPLEISCFAYPTMQRDLQDLLNAFAVWVNERNLWHLLKPANEDGSYAKTNPAPASAAPATQTAVPAGG